MDAVEIGGDGRGMSSAAAAGVMNTVEIPKDGWCLYNALLEVFRPPVFALGDYRRMYSARMFAFILGQFMIEAIEADPERYTRGALTDALGGEITYFGERGSGPERGFYTYEVANEEVRRTQGCIMVGPECRVKYDDPNEFFEHLHDTLPNRRDAKIWGDYMTFHYAIKKAFTIIATALGKHINISAEKKEGVPIAESNISVGPIDDPIPINITLIHTGNHFNVKFNTNWRTPEIERKINPITTLKTQGGLDDNKLLKADGEITDEIIALVGGNKERMGTILSSTTEVLPPNAAAKDILNKDIRVGDIVKCETPVGTSEGLISKLIKRRITYRNEKNGREQSEEEIQVEIQTGPREHSLRRGNICKKIGSSPPPQPQQVSSAAASPPPLIRMPVGAAPRYVDINAQPQASSVSTASSSTITGPPISGSPLPQIEPPMMALIELPQLTGSEGPDDLLIKAAKTLNIGAQLLLDLHRPAPRLPTAGAAPSVASRLRGAAGAVATGVTGALATARRAPRVPPAGRPQAPAAPAVPKPRLPPPSVAVRAPTRRRLPLTQPPPRRAPPALPVSLPSVVAAAAAAVGVSGEKQPRPEWAPAPMEASLRERCESMPIPTDECAQFELDKDIRAVHDFIERHQLRNTDPRMQDYIKDRESGKFSPADLAAKYPDHDVYVRTEGGRPVKMKVTNPYRAKSYRYPLEGSASFADPAGISDTDKPLHKQNLDLLKVIAPASVIADKRFATAILESLWRCSASQDLAGKPACFPARVLGELRLFQKYHDQASRKQLADDVRVFSEWGMVSDIMRQMIHGDVPPVRADTARVRKKAAEAATAAEAAAPAEAAPQSAPAAEASSSAAAGAGGAAMPTEIQVMTGDTVRIGDYVSYTPNLMSTPAVHVKITRFEKVGSGYIIIGIKAEDGREQRCAEPHNYCMKITKETYDAVAAAAPKPPSPAGPAIRAIRRGLAVRAPTQIGALGPRFQHGILPPTTIGAAGMVV